MTAKNLQPVFESPRLSAFDLVVRYAVLVSWVVYGAGLTWISGFLTTVGVPTESSSYALPVVLSNGTNYLFALLESALVPLLLLRLLATSQPLLKFFVWMSPAVVFLLSIYSFQSTVPVPIKTNVLYAICFLGAIYIFMFLLDGPNFVEASIGTHLIFAVVLFYLVVQGAGYRGDLEGYVARNAQPGVQFLLAPEAIVGATKLGVPFSSSDANLTDPLNVVAVSERMYYVRIPIRITDVAQVQNGMNIQFAGYSTIAIPRDKVIIASHK